MKLTQKNSTRALALFEALVVLAVVAALAATVILPRMGRHGCSGRMNCVNNLKQVGLGFRTWALDNNDRYPMQTSITNGGTMELIGTRRVFAHFGVMSNELSTPKILFCPQETDPSRQSASTFASTIPVGSVNQVPFTNDNNISYFVGVDAVDTSPQMVLTGDPNLSVNGVLVRRRLLNLWTNSVVTWANPRHESKGNIGLADGSVMQVGDKGLHKAFWQTGTTTNRLDLP